MTISEILRVESPVERYAEELVRLHGSLTYPGLADAIDGEPLCRLDRYGDRLTTVSFRESQLPERYLRGVLGFRLAQFLQTGLIDPELVYRRAMSHEPIVPASGPDTIHTVTLDETGRIVGYIAMVGAPDREPLALDDPARGRFPAEVAHDVDLLSPLAAPGRTTHNAYEIKRFVRDRAMAKGMQRDRVPWHLILAVAKVVLSRGDEIQLLLGDSGERGALRHLRLILLDLVVVEGTTPSLPRTELMWPSYHLPDERRAKPFVGVVPPDGSVIVDTIESTLLGLDSGNVQRQAVVSLIELQRASGRTAGAWGSW
jgi:hypothetical protein